VARRISNAFAVFALIALITGSITPAVAEGTAEGLYAPFGITGFYRTDGTAHFGAEISSVYFYGSGKPWWFGAYADATTDFDEFRFTAGTEFGFAMAGFDIGYAGIFTNDGYRHGLSLRGMIALPVVSIGDSRFLLAPYARYCHVWSGESSLEFGGMIKFALHLYSCADE